MAVDRTWGFVRVSPFISALRYALVPCGVATDRRRRVTGAGLLLLIAACLPAGLLAFIVFEASDDDLDLRPFGAKSITVVSPQEPVMGGQFGGMCSSRIAFQGGTRSPNPLRVVRHRARGAISPDSLSIGAHLVRRHRARNDIAPDSPSSLISFNMAEARGR